MGDRVCILVIYIYAVALTIYILYSVCLFFTLKFNATLCVLVCRKRQRTAAPPRGQWVPTCSGWTQAETALNQRTQASLSQKSPKRLGKCGNNLAKRRKRWHTELSTMLMVQIVSPSNGLVSPSVSIWTSHFSTRSGT